MFDIGADLLDSTLPFPTLIRQRGYRLTPQRQLVMQAIHALGGHCTPEEVYQQVHGKTPAINRATIYRTLEFLLELGLVTTGHLKGNTLIYELAEQSPHHHLVCQYCNHVELINHAQVAPLFNEIERDFAFHVNTDHLVLFGVCATCHPLKNQLKEHSKKQPEERLTLAKTG